MERARTRLTSTLDRIIDFTENTALEAAYLEERLQEQGMSLDPVDLLNLATAHTDGATFVTHNQNDFNKGPLHALVDVDVVVTD